MTVVEVAIRNVGYRKGMMALLYMMQWGTAADSGEVGECPSAGQVAEWWRENRRTTLRHQACFREAFGEENPQRLWGLAHLAVEARKDNRKEVLAQLASVRWSAA